MPTDEYLSVAMLELAGNCGTGAGGFKQGNKCQRQGSGGDTATLDEDELAPDKEWLKSKKLADAKIKGSPVPSKEAVAKARDELERARNGEGRAGGENRGGGSADRRRQRQNLFAEFGGEDRGYVVCPWSGIKMHWSKDADVNPNGYPTFERGKIFTKSQGGGYQLSNLLPESFTANRSRGDAPLRKENRRK